MLEVLMRAVVEEEGVGAGVSRWKMEGRLFCMFDLAITAPFCFSFLSH